MKRTLLAAVLAHLPSIVNGQPRMEHLSRGGVAIHQPDGRVAVSWRLLGNDPDGSAFNLYRESDPIPGGRGGFPGASPAASSRGPAPSSATAGGTLTPEAAPARGPSGRDFGSAAGEPIRLNREPLTGATFFVDETANLATRTSYFVRPVIGGVEQAPSSPFTLAAGAPPLPYLSVPLQTSPTMLPRPISMATARMIWW